MRDHNADASLTRLRKGFEITIPQNAPEDVRTSRAIASFEDPLESSLFARNCVAFGFHYTSENPARRLFTTGVPVRGPAPRRIWLHLPPDALSERVLRLFAGLGGRQRSLAVRLAVRYCLLEREHGNGVDNPLPAWFPDLFELATGGVAPEEEPEQDEPKPPRPGAPATDRGRRRLLRGMAEDL